MNTANPATRFSLKKWYMDVVDERGEVFISYAAELRWNRLSLSYHGFLRGSPDGGITSRNRFRTAPMPALAGSTLRWRAPGIEGEWRGAAAPIQEVLLEAQEGRIDWQCVLPRAEVDIRVGKDSLRGLGYAECIEMTLPPWELPIHELRWGRFLSSGHQIVWIQWLGPVPKLLIHHNGVRHDQGEIDETGISFGNTHLIFSESLRLRSGALMSTVLARAPWIRQLLPLSILRLDERKWRSRGRLAQEDQAAEEGWAIHESVRWL